MAYRVTFGETLPIWERVFQTLGEATEFAQMHHYRYGDTIFAIEKLSGEAAQAPTAPGASAGLPHGDHQKAGTTLPPVSGQ